MIENALNFDLTIEILYSYIYEKDMTFSKIDEVFRLPNGTSENILGICNIFRECGFQIYQGKRNIPVKSIYKLARVNLPEISEYFKSINYSPENDKSYIYKTINDKKYSREIKNAILKTAYDSRFNEIQSEKEELQYAYLKDSLKVALNMD